MSASYGGSERKQNKNKQKNFKLFIIAVARWNVFVKQKQNQIGCLATLTLPDGSVRPRIC